MSGVDGIGRPVVGTRGSALAVAQTRWLTDRLRDRTGVTCDLETVSTAGDRSTRALPDIGGSGVFVADLREAVLSGRVDVAVHSMKDLPSAPHPDLVVVAVPPRATPHDVLISRAAGCGLAGLRPGARVGTGSPRRRAHLLRARPDLEVVGVRGNVGTRLARVGDDLDAVVLAGAGLERLGLRPAGGAPLSITELMPAPAQGALAVEARRDARRIAGLFGVLDDADARASTTAERAVLARLGAGCTAAVAAYAHVGDGTGVGRLVLRARVASHDGREWIETADSGDTAHARELGERAADVLTARGAVDLLESEGARSDVDRPTTRKVSR